MKDYDSDIEGSDISNESIGYDMDGIEDKVNINLEYQDSLEPKSDALENEIEEDSFEDNNFSFGSYKRNEEEMELDMELQDDFLDNSNKLHRLNTEDLGSFYNPRKDEEKHDLSNEFQNKLSLQKEEINPQEIEEYNRLSRLVFRVVTQQFNLLLTTQVCKIIINWLKNNALDNNSNEMETLASIQIVCEKVRQKYPGSNKIEMEALLNVIKELSSNFELEDQQTIETNLLEQANFKTQDSFEKTDLLDITKFFHVINAFDMPKFNYSEVDKTFISVPNKKRMFLSAKEKSENFRQHFHLLKARILRNENFIPRTTFSRENEKTIELSSIKSLIGRYNQPFCIFGMINFHSQSEIYLEDLENSIRLEFNKDYRLGKGLFTNNSFVLVEGIMSDDQRFIVNSLALPPYEASDKTDAHHSQIDFNGTFPFMLSPNMLDIVHQEFPNISIIFVSDVFLDQQITFDALNKLFTDLEFQDSPLAIVLMGSFCSNRVTYDGNGLKGYKENFDKLGELIARFDNLKTWTRFVFIPGPNDPTFIDALPTPALDPHLYSGLEKHIKNLEFTSNPCRIHIANHTIVIMRQNLINKVLRNLIIPMNEKHANNPTTIQKYLIRTIIDGGHLVPLSSNIQPILLGYDNTLTLHSNPELLIIADETPAFTSTYKDVVFINPGKLVPNNNNKIVSYFIYRPIVEKLEKGTIYLD